MIAISAIIVAIPMIEAFTKKLKFKRKIILVTNGTGMMSDDNIQDVAEKLDELNVELLVLYVSL
jgi:ATP-dependent DNA helicase 2 subunit 2